jgi:hypothetical protein
MATHGGYTNRSAAWAVAQVFIQCFSILGTKIFDQPPRFFKGHGTVIGLLVLTAAGIILKWWIMWRANRTKDAVAAEYVAKGRRLPNADKSLEELNDKHPHFRYLL